MSDNEGSYNLDLEYDYDSDHGLYIGGPEYQSSLHEKIQPAEELNRSLNHTAEQPENHPDSPILIPIYIISSDEESEEVVSIPEQSILPSFSREVLKRRIEKIGDKYEQRRSYLDNLQDVDMMTPCPVAAPHLPPPKKHRRSFSF